jgi:hypothetical protein
MAAAVTAAQTVFGPENPATLGILQTYASVLEALHADG